MKRILGCLFMLLGAFCLIQFTVRAMFHGQGGHGDTFGLMLPFLALGKDYPTDALYMVGSLISLLIGVGLIIPGEPKKDPATGRSVRGGKVARAMLLNSLLLFGVLIVAFIGGKTRAGMPKVEKPAAAAATAAKEAPAAEATDEESTEEEETEPDKPLEPEPNAMTVGVLGSVAFLQMGIGLLLLLLALAEKPKGWISLLLGLIVYAGAVAFGVLAFLMGGGGA